MSLWSDRITQHPVHTVIVNLQATLAAARDAAKETPEARASLDRVRSIVDYLAARLEAVDPSLGSPAALDVYPNQLAAIQSNLTNFNADRSTSNVEQANAHADPILSGVGGLPVCAG